MKNILCFLFLLLFLSAKGQVVLTPYGFADINDTAKKYIVLDMSQKTRRQLFNETLATINKSILTNSKKRTIDTVGGTSILLTGETQPSKITKRSIPFYWKYSFSYSFKDGKIRFEVNSLIFEAKGSAGEIFKISNPNKNASKYACVFGYENQVVNQEAKTNIEKFVNDLINNTILGIKEWETW